jgi:hypothetical protein
MNTSASTPPPDDPTKWTTPSAYSVIVIVVVLALIGGGLYVGKLTFTESLIAALLGLLTWVTKGARPPIADKIGKPPTAGGDAIPLIITPILDADKPRDEMLTPREPPESKPRTALTFALVTTLLLGCASATPQEKAAAADASYQADMLVCVDDAGDRSGSRECRAKVRQKWHVDAGVPQ